MKIKGSSVIIAFMYVTWVAYLLLQIWCRQEVGAFLPMEVTYGTAALFIAETVSLARLKMAKEGEKVKPKSNTMLGKIGIVDSGFENEVADEMERQAENGKTQ